MRRVTLTLLFCLAACGGNDLARKSTSSDPTSASASRQKYLLGPEAAAIISDFAQSHSEQAIDACLEAWVVGDVGPEGTGEGPISKPDSTSLRGFLTDCLGG